MVSFEVISSNPLSFQTEPTPCDDFSKRNGRMPRTEHSNNGTQLALLARDCACSFIQATFRGYLQRSRLLKDDSMQLNNTRGFDVGDSTQNNDTEDGQSKIETNDAFCQTEGKGQLECSSDPPLLQSLTVRRAAVMEAHEQCKQGFNTVHLNGTEVLNILKAMAVIGPREYEGLFKVAYDSTYHARYPIGIDRSIDEFENDLIKAWRDMNDETNRSHIPLPKRRINFCLNRDETKRAKISLQDMINVPQGFLSYIVENHGVLAYTEEVKKHLLRILCITDRNVNIDTNGKTNIVDLLSLHSRSEGGSLYSNRLELAGQILRCISEWERTLLDGQDGDARSQILRLKLCEEKSKTFKLRDEVLHLSEQLKQATMAHGNAEKEKDLYLAAAVPLKAESKSYTTSVITPSRTQKPTKDSKVSSMTDKPSSRRQTKTQRDLVCPKSADSKEVKYSKVNTVEIKFDGEKPKSRKSRPTSRKQASQSTSTSARRKKKKSPSQRNISTIHARGNSGDDEFSQMMNRARQKRQHDKRVAWKDDNDDTDALFSDLKKDPNETSEADKMQLPKDHKDLFTRRRTEMPSTSANEAFETSSNARFNAILERLRLHDT